MYHLPFAVIDKVFCVWEHDLPARNKEFLESLDPKYFRFVAQTCDPVAHPAEAQRAAAVLRITYFHAIETLFSLLGAFLQAPECVPAWIAKATTGDLRELVRRIRTGDDLILPGGRQSVTFEEVSARVHSVAFKSDEPLGATADRFAQLWIRLATEMPDVVNIDEYNSLKHGFRVGLGGFSLRTGVEPELGVPPAPEEMQSLGQSSFGSTFFKVQRIVDDRPQHIRIRRQSVNWNTDI
jgi:hypothetical protein